MFHATFASDFLKTRDLPVVGFLVLGRVQCEVLTNRAGFWMYRVLLRCMTVFVFLVFVFACFDQRFIRTL